jgi:hypothetical protein
MSIAGRLGRNLNLGPPEYEAGVLTARPRCSVEVGSEEEERERCATLGQYKKQHIYIYIYE